MGTQSTWGVSVKSNNKQLTNMDAKIVLIPIFLLGAISASPLTSGSETVENDTEESLFGVDKALLAEAVILSSDGVAADYQGSKLGLYIRNGTANGAPLYQQIDSGEPSSYIFKYDSHWLVGSDPSVDKGWFQNTETSTTVPTLWWQYFNNGWYHDSGIGIKVEKVDEIDICSSVYIIGDDEANRLASEYLGRFDAIKGKFSAGRMVYKNEESGKTLEVRPGVTNWLIFDDKPGVIASGNGANSMNPSDPVAARSFRFPNRKSWGFGLGNNEYRTNLNLTFYCLPY